jgi:hypothetical protein
LHQLQFDPPFSQAVDSLGVTGHQVGLCARDPETNVEIVGSAFAQSEATAQIKAAAELAERICALRESKGTVRLPTSAYALSNGWAAHTDPNQARRSAFLETVERHNVLWYWYSGTPPKRDLNPMLPTELGSLREQTDLYILGRADIAVRMAIIRPLPNQKMQARILGFAADHSEANATRRSALEALQRWSFLFDEDLDNDPTSLPASALYQQEWGLSKPGQSLLQNWLDGALSQLTLEYVPELDEARATYETHRVGFQDTTLHVVKCHHPDSIPLVFGSEPKRLLPFIPNNATRWIHPIA